MKDKIYIPSFGYQKVMLTEIEKLEDLFIAEFYYKKQKYEGIIDKNSQLLVPFSTNSILEASATPDKSECYFTREYNQDGYQSYHLSKKHDKYQLIADIHGDDYSSLRLVNTAKNNYWFIEHVVDNLTEYSLYNPYQAKVLTPFFTEITFYADGERIFAYVEKDLTIGNIILGSMCSFIDKDGKFVTPIYVPEFDLQYDARRYNTDSSFRDFALLSDSIKSKLIAAKKEKDSHVADVLANLFRTPYDEDDMTISHAPAKIIKFPGGSNETK